MRKRWLKPVLLPALMTFCIPFSAMAQKPAPTPPAKTGPVVVTAPAWETGAYWSDVDQRLLVDFANLAQYRAANAQLGPPHEGAARVVFLGDSITEGWKLEQSFPRKPYVNRGISGQTTSQILLRFRQDVIDLHPRVVVILAGTNDLAENTGPTTDAQIEGNLESMAQLARANHIAVVLCSILPTVHYKWHPQLPNPAPRIAAINRSLAAYAARAHDVYVDYYAALKDPQGALKQGLSSDGVHPLPAGFAIMAPLAQAGIDHAMHER